MDMIPALKDFLNSIRQRMPSGKHKGAPNWQQILYLGP